jgi:hypothetical protein
MPLTTFARRTNHCGVAAQREQRPAFDKPQQAGLIRTRATAFDLSPMNFGVDDDVNRNQGEVNEDRDWN